MGQNRKIPMRLFRVALILVGLFVVGHLAGLREMTGILSGTMPPAHYELFLGMFYVVLWFGAVLAAPMFALAGAFHLGILEIAKVAGRVHTSMKENRPSEIALVETTREHQRAEGLN